MHGLFDFNSFQNQNNRKATNSFAPRLLFLSCNKFYRHDPKTK